MSLPLRQLDDAPLPPRLASPALVDAGGLEQLEQADAQSPAHLLQQRLLRAYLAPEPGPVQAKRSPVVAAVTIIGLSLALWGALGGAAMLLIA